MFSPAGQPIFTLTLHSNVKQPLPGFKVLAFTGHEAINQPYRFDLELVSEQRDLDLQALLYKPAYLTLDRNGRGIHGLIHRISQDESGKRLSRYRLSLVPHLANLGQRSNQRIFQKKTVQQIIALILKEHGILEKYGYRFELGPHLSPAIDYCTQYDETDLHFLNRLCEEHGLHYHFEHASEGHIVVFGDDQTAFSNIAPTAFSLDSGLNPDTPVIKSFSVRLEARTHRVTRRDYNFKKPARLPEAEARPFEKLIEPDLEDYDYPARFIEERYNQQLARRALERHRHNYRQASGHSDQPTLCAGYFLPLTNHPRKVCNQLWLLTEVWHEGRQPQVLEESGSSSAVGEDGFTQGYRNRFTATPWDVHYRPALKHPRPRVLGTQTAVVTGPPNEQIYCDHYGRIKVQFHWDREAKGNEHSSCWLRVASGWAGNRYGAITIPRIGMEVLVSFLEGDPDQPLVSGCLFNGEHMPPDELPANKTRSIFKSLSSPGSEGSNELRIEDLKGQEQIYLHAQRDWEQHIRRSQRVHVGHERHDTVQANSYSEFKAEVHDTIHADRKVEVRANDHLTVTNEQHLRLGVGQFVEAGREIHLNAGLKVVIEAGMELTLSAGGHFIKIDASGISLSGAQVKINSGGSPGSGTPATPLLPGALQQASANTSGLPLTTAQINTFKHSAPFCEECAKCQEGVCAA